MDDAVLADFTTTVNGQAVTTNLGLFALNILKAKAAQKDRKAAADLLNLYYDKLRARNSQQDSGGVSPEEQAIIDNLLDAAGWSALPAIRNVRAEVDGETDDE